MAIALYRQTLSTLVKHRGLTPSIALCVVFTTLFSFVSYLKVVSLTASVYDLGFGASLLHAVSASLFQYGRIYPTYYIIVEPFSLVLSIFYSVFPGLYPILILQDASVAFSSLFIYLVARLYFSGRWVALSVQFMYLMYTPLWGIPYFDFHFEAFFPIFFSGFCYFLLKDRPVAAITMGVVASSTTNPAGLFVFLTYAVYALPGLLGWVVSKSHLLGRFPFRVQPIHGYLTRLGQLPLKRWMLLGAVVSASQFATSWLAVSRMYVLGRTAPFDAAAGSNIIDAATQDLQTKVIWLILILAPLLFLPLIDRGAYVFIAYVLVAFASNYPSYYQFYWDYGTIYVVIVFVSYIRAIHSWERREIGQDVQSVSRPIRPSRQVLRVVSTSIVVTLLVFSVYSVASPVVNQAQGNFQIVNSIPAIVSYRDSYTADYLSALASIGSSGSALIQYDMPSIAALRFPSIDMPVGITGLATTESGQLTRSSFPNWWMTPDWFNVSTNPNWVITDPYSWSYYQNYFTNASPMSDLASFYYSESGAYNMCGSGPFLPPYGVYAEVDGSLVFERGYHGSLRYYVPENVTLSPSGGRLFEGYSYAFQPLAPVRLVGGNLEITNSSVSQAWTGPGIYLGPGEYEISVALRSSSLASGNAMKFSVGPSSGVSLFNSTVITGSSIRTANEWESFSLNITTRTPQSHVQITATSVRWAGVLDVRSLSVTQTAPAIVATSTQTRPVKCLPITIRNPGRDAIGTFDERIILNTSAYGKIFNSGLTNIEFAYPNGTAIPAWIESGASNTSSSTTVWLRLAPMAPGGSTLLYLEVWDPATDLMSATGFLGEAPNLSSRCGQFDNGAVVFPSYWDFCSAGLPPGWGPFGRSANYTGSGGGLYLEPGIAVTYNTGAFGPGSEADAFGVINPEANLSNQPSISGVGFVDNVNNDYVGFLNRLGVNSSNIYGLVVNGAASNSASPFSVMPNGSVPHVWSVAFNQSRSSAALDYFSPVSLPSEGNDSKVLVVGNQAPSGLIMDFFWLRVLSPLPGLVTYSIGS